jgi:hypothetical protein
VAVEKGMGKIGEVAGRAVKGWGGLVFLVFYAYLSRLSLDQGSRKHKEVAVKFFLITYYTFD